MNKVGSLTTDRHHALQFRPAHAELLDERRVRFDGPSANRFEHLVDPIWRDNAKSRQLATQLGMKVCNEDED